MLTSTRRRLGAVALVLLLPTLGACGFGYQTDQVYQPGVGVNNRDGSVDILGGVVVSGSDGSGTVVASLANKDTEEPAKLIGVTSKQEGIEPTLVAPVEIDADSLVNLAEMGAIAVNGESVAPGGFARLVFEFDTGQRTELNMPIVPRENEFSDIAPAIPSPSATP